MCNKKYYCYHYDKIIYIVIVIQLLKNVSSRSYNNQYNSNYKSETYSVDHHQSIIENWITMKIDNFAANNSQTWQNVNKQKTKKKSFLYELYFIAMFIIIRDIFQMIIIMVDYLIRQYF